VRLIDDEVGSTDDGLKYPGEFSNTRHIDDRDRSESGILIRHTRFAVVPVFCRSLHSRLYFPRLLLLTLQLLLPLLPIHQVIVMRRALLLRRGIPMRREILTQALSSTSYSYVPSTTISARQEDPL